MLLPGAEIRGTDCQKAIERVHYYACKFYMCVRVNKKKMSSFKSNENIHKKKDGSYYVVSANKASSVTL